MYTEAQLVTFGNYLLSRYDVRFYSTDGKNTPLDQRQVTRGDITSWKEDNPQKLQPGQIQLPSQHQIDDKVYLQFPFEEQENDPKNRMPADCRINAVHFYTGKVKYDIEINFSDDTYTRIYNIDSVFVIKPIDSDS